MSTLSERLRGLNAIANAAPAPPKATLVGKFAAPNVRPATDWQLSSQPVSVTLGRSRPPVERSDDLKRVLELPRRPPVDLDAPEAKALTARVNARYARHNPSCSCASLGRPCITSLKATQAWALDEMQKAGGLLGAIGVGHGKSILNLLAPLAVPDCKLAVVLVPPNLQDQLGREYDALSQHFRVPTLVLHGKMRRVPGAPVLHVVPYSKFSRADSTAMLEELNPDLVIADEGHKLRHADTATTGRVLRHFARNPSTRLCVWSGTLTSKSLKDYAHLSALALKDGSPLPLEPNVVEEWALALDPIEWNAPAGALYLLCNKGEHVREGFRRRLHDTQGVVATKSGSVDATLVLAEHKAPPIPKEVADAIADTLKYERRPDGEELVDILRVTECARELACGFYYRWRFPHGSVKSAGCTCKRSDAEACEPCRKLVDEWFDARKAWSRELREKLKRRVEHLDSPLLLANAAIRFYAGYKGPLPTWRSASWEAWRDIRERVKPVPEEVWISDYLARDAAEWARKHKGLVWFAHRAFGRKVASLARLPCYDGDATSPRVVEMLPGPDGVERAKWNEDGKRSVILSISRYGTGTDGLQHRFAHQLVANPPSSGATWEQMLGRLSRIGQQADEITTEVYRHTSAMSEAIDRAIIQAKYVEQTTGSFQKLLNATVTFDVKP